MYEYVSRYLRKGTASTIPLSTSLKSSLSKLKTQNTKPEAKEQVEEQTSMACLIAPVAAVLIVNHRESKDKIMVRLLFLMLYLSVGFFAVGGNNLEQSLFCFLTCFGYHMCFCSSFVTN